MAEFSYYCSTCRHRFNCADSEFQQNSGCDHYRNENAKPFPFEFDFNKKKEQMPLTGSENKACSEVKE